MSSLHGECTPQTLHNLLHIPKVDAKRYVSQLLADGVIKPNPLLQKSVSQVLKSKNDTILDKVKKRSEMKAQAKTDQVKICETVETTDNVNIEEELIENLDEDDLEIIIEDEHAEEEPQNSDETELQG